MFKGVNVSEHDKRLKTNWGAINKYQEASINKAVYINVFFGFLQKTTWRPQLSHSDWVTPKCTIYEYLTGRSEARAESDPDMEINSNPNLSFRPVVLKHTHFQSTIRTLRVYKRNQMDPNVNHLDKEP